MSVSRHGTVDSGFWRLHLQRFVALRQEDSRHSRTPLGANYHPEGWDLDEVRAFRGRSAGRWLLDHGTLPVVEDFKSIAGLCAVALGAPNTDLAWVEWLEALRRESADYKPSEMSVDSLHREWRPEPDFEVLVGGVISLPLEVRPDPDATVILIDVGEIADVCGASERLCQRLADEALRMEIQEPARKSGRTQAGRATGGASLSGWTVTQDWEAELVPGGLTTPSPQSVGSSESIAASRRGVVEPLLAARGWSTLDWAKAAGVDYNTANDYLNRLTTPRRDTLKKLAQAVGLNPADMPI